MSIELRLAQALRTIHSRARRVAASILAETWRSGLSSAHQSPIQAVSDPASAMALRHRYCAPPGSSASTRCSQAAQLHLAESLVSCRVTIAWQAVPRKHVDGQGSWLCGQQLSLLPRGNAGLIPQTTRHLSETKSVLMQRHQVLSSYHPRPLTIKC